jgi:hypothetical protein
MKFIIKHPYHFANLGIFQEFRTFGEYKFTKIQDSKVNKYTRLQSQQRYKTPKSTKMIYVRIGFFGRHPERKRVAHGIYKTQVSIRKDQEGEYKLQLVDDRELNGIRVGQLVMKIEISKGVWTMDDDFNRVKISDDLVTTHSIFEGRIGKEIACLVEFVDKIEYPEKRFVTPCLEALPPPLDVPELTI